MVLGAVPLAIAIGASAESRAQIGWVIAGGITVPTAYTLLARTRHPAASGGTADDGGIPPGRRATE